MLKTTGRRGGGGGGLENRPETKSGISQKQKQAEMTLNSRCLVPLGGKERQVKTTRKHHCAYVGRPQIKKKTRVTEKT